MTGPRDRLHDALLDLEASAPIGSPPPLRASPNRRPLWVAAGGVAAAAVLVGVVVGNAVLDRRSTGQATPPTSPTSTTSPRVSASATPSPSPTSMPGPTAQATLSPHVTLAPRAGWAVVPSTALEGVERLDGIAEVAGRLFALGSDARVQPMIWFSDDGETWQPAEVDGVPDEYGGQVKALIDAGDRLVAVAALGFAQGSGYFGTVIYTSEDDGQTWRTAESTPGLTGTAIFDLALAGPRVLAVGSSVWVSDDGGRTWTETAAGPSQEGVMRSVDGDEDLLLAAGSFGSDITEPPALAWLSRDGGITWQRTVLDENGGASGALVTSSGDLLVTGYDAEGSILWSSPDDGAVWRERNVGEFTCCPTGLVETPSGIVIGRGIVEPYGVLASADGEPWSFESLNFRLRELAWTETFGLVAISEDSEIVLGPEPYP